MLKVTIEGSNPPVSRHASVESLPLRTCVMSYALDRGELTLIPRQVEPFLCRLQDL